jgi:hypothetical protein
MVAILQKKRGYIIMKQAITNPKSRSFNLSVFFLMFAMLNLTACSTTSNSSHVKPKVAEKIKPKDATQKNYSNFSCKKLEKEGLVVFANIRKAKDIQTGMLVTSVAVSLIGTAIMNSGNNSGVYIRGVYSPDNISFLKQQKQEMKAIETASAQKKCNLDFPKRLKAKIKNNAPTKNKAK